ncbi:unnamed protein product [Rhodiola kirilowii]
MTKSSYLALWWVFCMIVLLVFGEVSGQCLEHQKSLLVKLKQSLSIMNNTLPWDSNRDCGTRIPRWDSNRDCCGWPGVACSNNGYVTGLDLSSECIEEGLNNSSPLFELQYLTNLNLAGNILQWRTDMSFGFERLVNLTHLNMSSSFFSGPFPIEISNLTRLVTLDLSSSYCDGASNSNSHFNLGMLISNMSKLTQLWLDHVDYLGVQGSEWSQLVSSYLPRLQVLSLGGFGLWGSFNSLTQLKSLTYLDLSINHNMRGNILDSLGELKMLSVLKLEGCNLQGSIPSSLTQLKSLTYLDLSDNYNINGNIPDSLGELKMLSVLKLGDCNLQGSIPSSLTQLTTLTYLDLSSNELSGQIPSLSRSKNLKYLELGDNKLTGSILGTNWSDLSQLEKINFYGNALSGSIPDSLFGIPTLQMLDFGSNQFTKFTSEPVITSSSQLETLGLSQNDLQGPFPSFIFKLQALRTIDVEFNNFSGTFYMDSLHQLRNLSFLALSYNSMSTEFGENLTFPDSFWLGLASCKLKAFPKFLKNNIKFQFLDLSANQIRGEIPHWIWNTLEFQSYLNLSHNQLQTFESPLGDLQYHEVTMLDLSSNKLNGKIPQIPSAYYLDLSHNLFESVVFSSINISVSSVLSISNNRLQGSISKLLCNTATLSILDLSSNFLSDILPSCLLQMPSLGVLNLKNNSISGIIPDLFLVGCGLQIVTLNGNSLVGSIPKSLTKCTSLEVLDLGNNKLHDGFPCWMSDILTLEVLVLEFNMLEGSIICPGVNVTWPSLHILDIASNNFSGNLPSQQLLGWKAMMINEEATSMLNRYANYIQYSTATTIHYKFEIALTLKSIEVILQISRSFAMIDLSDNSFEGAIPDEIGYLNALRGLNISYNTLAGQIPSSLGRMKNLESLDLQNNWLSGKIPTQLANLNFLAVLNLSFNQLEGMIPNGGQFQTFSKDSFLHNKGLCGFPLNTSCAKDVKVKPLPKPFFEVEGSVLISTEVGYAVGLGLIIMPLLFWTRWRMKFYEITDNILLKIFSLKFQRTQVVVR